MTPRPHLLRRSSNTRRAWLNEMALMPPSNHSGVSPEFFHCFVLLGFGAAGERRRGWGTHAKAVSDPFQRHRRLAAETNGDLDLLRVALAAVLQGYLGSPASAASTRLCISRFDQTPVASTLFLQASRLLGDWPHAPREVAASVPPAAG